jgi:hypothetical protein
MNRKELRDAANAAAEAYERAGRPTAEDNPEVNALVASTRQAYLAAIGRTPSKGQPTPSRSRVNALRAVRRMEPGTMVDVGGGYDAILVGIKHEDEMLVAEVVPIDWHTHPTTVPAEFVRSIQC